MPTCEHTHVHVHNIPSSVQPPVMDENERIALQEKEDERLARELEAREHSGGNLEVQYDQNVTAYRSHLV